MQVTTIATELYLQIEQRLEFYHSIAQTRLPLN
jgi:hypothetical protein